MCNLACDRNCNTRFDVSDWPGACRQLPAQTNVPIVVLPLDCCNYIATAALHALHCCSKDRSLVPTQSLSQVCHVITISILPVGVLGTFTGGFPRCALPCSTVTCVLIKHLLGSLFHFFQGAERNTTAVVEGTAEATYACPDHANMSAPGTGWSLQLHHFISHTFCCAALCRYVMSNSGL